MTLASLALAAAVWTAPPLPACSERPPLRGHTVAVGAGADLAGVVASQCDGACTLRLAPGRYPGGIQLGEGAGSGPAWTGESLQGPLTIEASDPVDPPVLVAPVGFPGPVLHVANPGHEVRVRGLVLDGRRYAQDARVLDSACADADRDGTCDAAADTNKTWAGGLWLQSSREDPVRGCVEDVTVLETVWNGIQISHGGGVSITDSRVQGAGCGPDAEDCEGLDAPTHAGSGMVADARGINVSRGRGNVVMGNRIERVTKIAVQLVGEAGSGAYRNRAEETGLACYAVLHPEGRIELAENEGEGCGRLHAGRPGNLAPGIVVRREARGPPVPRVIVAESRLDWVWGYGIQADGAVDLRLTGNRVMGACRGEPMTSPLRYGRFLRGLASLQEDRNDVGGCPENSLRRLQED